MKITRLEKILLALMLAGSLTRAASAETKTYTFTPNGSSSAVTAATVTVTVSTEQKTYTYIDAEGKEQTLTYTTITEAPTVTVNVTGLSDLNLNYDSPNDNPTGTETTEKKYYAWTEDGFVETDANGKYTVTNESGATTEKTATVNVTVSYVPLVDGSEYKNGYINDSTDNSVNISADFVGDSSHGGTSDATHGGAIDNYAQSGNASLGTITGNFIGNHEDSTTASDYGGAIANYVSSGSSCTATIESINGNFIGNYVNSTSGQAWGGAIFNSGSTAKIVSIEADFVGNHAKSTGNYTGTNQNASNGGAIYNSNSTIESIKGNFIGNYAEASGTYGDSNSACTADGGAIYNTGSSGKINKIEGNFIGNYGTSLQGAVYGGTINNCAGGTIGEITGYFIGNYAETGDTASKGNTAYGGGIYNSGTFNSIAVDFIGNYSKTLNGGSAYGGAIYNIGTIGNLGTSTNKSNFISNYADSTAGNAYGGAINNSGGTIDDIVGDFIGNYATTTGTYAYGGAIYNVINTSGNGGTIKSIAGDFIGNYATTTGTGTNAVAWGGAIYNTGKITGSVDETTEKVTAAISGNFIDNKATSSANDSYGGAIYNQGTIGTLAEDGTVSVAGISNSTFEKNTAARGGAIYNGTQKTEVDDEESEAGRYENYTSVITSIENSSFVGNTATKYGGAIYNYDDGAIYTIANNYFIENVATDGNGGAIENAEAFSYIGDITGNVFYKNEVTQSNHGGGAIYNEGIIDSLTENYFEENSSGNFGGAIYNNGGTIGGGGAEVSDGDLDQNSDEKDVDNPAGAISGNCFSGNTSGRGGAIYNTATRSVVSDAEHLDLNVTETLDLSDAKETLDLSGENTTGLIMGITGNNFVNNTASNFGGAIYNYHGGEIGSISNNYFEDNQAKGGNGGAVENAEFDTSIGTMDGNTFVNNSATGNGGAIYNQGTIGILDSGEAGDAITNSKFKENSAANGGAIYNNYGTSTVYAYDADGKLATGETGTQVGTYTDDNGNSLYKFTIAGAGAIGNISNCYFYGNKAVGTTDSSGNTTGGSGGAIYNASGTADNGETYTATMGTITNTSFVNNSAVDKGGAIYSASDLTIAADGSQENGSVVFQNNKATNGGDAIFMATDETTGEAATVEFRLSNGGKIYLYDNIQGDEGYGVEVTTDGSNTTFYLLNDVSGANLSVGGVFETTDDSGDASPNSIQPMEDDPTDPTDENEPTDGNDSTDSGDSETSGLTLSTINGDAHVYNVNSFTVAGDFNMEADVDLKNEKMDRFVTTEGSSVTGDSTLNVSALNIYSDTTKNSVAVYFAEEGLMKNVTSSVSSAVGPIYEYDLTYLYKDENDQVYDQEGKIYEGEDFDTSLLNSEGGYFVFGNTGRNNPAVMASPVAMMGAYGAMNMMFDYNFEHSDYFMKLPEEVRLAQREQAKAKKSQKRIAESDATKPAYYNQNELTNRGAWFRSFATNESVSYRGRYTSRDKYYGGLVGFDSDLHEHKNGWASVTTGYAGTMGIRQDYSGGKIKQHGGMIGVTESFYRKNFYTAWTIAAGTTKAHAHTMYGKDSSRNDTYGIAARFGWNIDMDYNGKFAIVPTFTASYTYVNPEDFTNAAGVKITGSGLRAVQLNPNVKFVWKMNDGWQPYLSVGEVWTVGQSLHMRTDGQKLLDELELRAYTEYGIGVQKRWADEKDAYVQVMGHSDGRDGILVNAGIRWNF